MTFETFAANRKRCPHVPFASAARRTGLGLFATKPIKRRATIATYRGRRMNPEEADRLEARGSRYMFTVNKRVTIDGSPRWNVARYINHSCRPNAGAGRPQRRHRHRGAAPDRAGRGNHLRLRQGIYGIFSGRGRLPLRLVPPQTGRQAPQAAESGAEAKLAPLPTFRRRHRPNMNFGSTSRPPRPSIPAKSLKAPSPPICRCCNRPSSSLSSTCRQRARSASRCRRICYLLSTR